MIQINEMRKKNNKKKPEGCQSQKHLGKLYPIITIKVKCLLIFLRNRNMVILESTYSVASVT